jgi:CTP synthase
VKELRAIGIHPDIIACRSEVKLSKDVRSKISLFCDVRPEAVFGVHNVSSIYEVPLLLEKEQMDQIILEMLELEPGKKQAELSTHKYIEKLEKCHKEVTIAIAGKYVSLEDAYISIVESIKHAAVDQGLVPKIRWINTEEIETEDGWEKKLEGVDGVIVPGGFGNRGIEGKLKIIQVVRGKKIPYLGICLGMQTAVIEFARNVCGLKDAHSTEFAENTKNPVIDLMLDQKRVVDKGGTMRLGAYPCKIVKDTKLAELYGVESVSERHRHRYEFNNKYREILEKKGMVLSGLSPNSNLVEVIELKDHPYFIASQYHPEFKSRPGKPHPLFKGLIQAAASGK